MVRFKVRLRLQGCASFTADASGCFLQNRWLLVRIDYDKSEQNTADGSVPSMPTQMVGAGGTPMQLQLLRTLRDMIALHFGDVGAGAIAGSLAVRYYSSTTNHAIVRTARLGIQQVWAALTMCTHLGGRRVRLIVTHCGGTIRKVQQAAIRQDYKVLARMHAEQEHGAALAGVDSNRTSTISSTASSLRKSIPLDEASQEILENNKRAVLKIQP